MLEDLGGGTEDLRVDDTDQLVFYVFDLLFLEGVDLRSLPLRKRKQRLKQLLAAHKVEPSNPYFLAPWPPPVPPPNARKNSDPSGFTTSRSLAE